VAVVAEKAARTPPGEWIIGGGWHQEKWPESPEHNVQGYPYHHDLSRVSPQNPVMLSHASGHAVFANKAAMDLAGVNREMRDPTGGHIVRGDGGDAIGVFEENAKEIINDVYRQYLTTLSEQQLREKWYEGVRLAQDECLKKGITSFQDAGISLQEVDRFKELAIRGELDLRLWMMIRHTSEFLEGKLSRFPIVDAGNGFFTCRALKVGVDGALGSYGAWLLEPYVDRAGFTGQNTTTIEEVRKLSEMCYRQGLQMCTHAIGDRANREVLNIYEEFIDDMSKDGDLRWRIEHAQHLDIADIPRFGTLGVIASMQGIHCTSDAPFVERRLGAERARNGAYVWRSLLDSGAVVTNGTDAPVEDVNPIHSFYASVTRKRVDTGAAFYPEQALTRSEAIYSYTLANAYAAFEEETKGSLKAGKYADLVILDKNLLTCTDAEILDTQVKMTIVNGEIKYRATGF
jgi:predicted amidohydrolase YtcJ